MGNTLKCRPRKPRKRPSAGDMRSAGGGPGASNRKAYSNRDPGQVTWDPLAGDTAPRSERHGLSETIGRPQPT